MNSKELSELRRRWRLEKNAVSRIYGCYVNSAGSIVSDLDEPLGAMTEEEGEKYLELLRKALSGTLGKNLIDIAFTTRQVADSDEHRLLSALRNSRLQDGQARQALYRQVAERLDMGGDSYLLLLACDSYDVPHRGKDGEDQPDASEEVFTYIVCSICPVRGKPELGYYPGDNEFHCTSGQVAGPPELGFLFPAFDGRASNIYNALFYSRKADELHQEFIDAVFRTEPPMSAGEQRETFREVLSAALEDSCSVEVVQGLHEGLTERLTQHKESRSPEPLTVTPGEICGILRECGVPEERTEAFRQTCDARFGPDSSLRPENLIDAGKFQLRTPQATVSVEPDSSYLVETRIIDGRKYLLIPVEEDVEVNGLPVRFQAGPSQEDAQESGDPGSPAL